MRLYAPGNGRPSHARDPVAVEVELRLDADYSPMLEVRGIAPRRCREVRRERRRGELRFAGVGLDGIERSTIVSCGVAETLEDGRLRVRLELQPGEEALLDIRFDFVHGRESVAAATVARAATETLFVSHAGADAEAWLAGRCRVTVDDDLIARVVRRSLLDLRLLASELDGHRYYAAGVPWYAYHTGSVWPHDNAMFAAGLRKYGLDAPFLRVMEGLLDVASVLPDYRLPELFAGFSRADYEDPVPYPVACSPQAWAAGALPCLLIATLGIVPDALDGTLRIRRPSLPRHLDRATVEGLRVGDARVDLLFERVGRGDSVALTDARVEGRVDVVLEIRQESGPDLGASTHASLEPTARGLVI